MRRPVDAERLARLMQGLGRSAEGAGRVYLTGGATAVLYGWRASTIDVDLKMVPEQDALFRAIQHLKEELAINVELASPADFIPELPGWAERSPSIGAEGPLTFHHYDLYAQALAKIERGHTKDLEDVEAMIARRLVSIDRLQELFDAIEPQLVRYPAIDAPTLRKAVDAVAERHRR
jgi:hypothetical protein